jgi:hypothetical protein
MRSRDSVRPQRKRPPPGESRRGRFRQVPQTVGSGHKPPATLTREDAGSWEREKPTAGASACLRPMPHASCRRAARPDGCDQQTRLAAARTTRFPSGPDSSISTGRTGEVRFLIVIP